MKSTLKTSRKILFGAIAVSLFACEATPAEVKEAAAEPETAEVKSPEQKDGVLPAPTEKQEAVAPPQEKKVKFVPPVVMDEYVDDVPPADVEYMNTGTQSDDFNSGEEN